MMKISDHQKSISNEGFGLTRRTNRILKSPDSNTNHSSTSSVKSNGSNGSASKRNKNRPHRKPVRSLSPPPPGRTELWGQSHPNKRRIGAGSNHSRSSASAASASIQSIESLDPIAVSAAGTSSMYGLFTQELDNMVESEPVKKVLKLMFSSLAVVFQETQTSSTTKGMSVQVFTYTRIPSIPASAARLLWSELMGGIKTEPDVEHGGYLMQAANEYKRDPCIDAETLDKFVEFVNGDNDLFVRKEKETGFWGKLFNKKKKEQDESEVSIKMPPRHKVIGRDPFLYFVRDALVATGLLELAGRRVDDEDWGDEEDELEEDTEDTSAREDLDDDDDDDDDGGDDDGVAADFTGWDKRKRKIRKQRITQYFQIYKDMQFQYGVYLSGVPESDGGFAASLQGTQDDATDAGSVACREQDTMKRWNDAMSNACARQLMKTGIIEKRGGSTDTVPNDAWITSRRSSPFDDATSYAVQMYPSHLLRSGRVTEAARVLMNPRFFLARLCSLEPFGAANRHRANVEELCARSKIAKEGNSDLGGDGDLIDATEITMASVNVMVKALKERYPITGERDSIEKVKGEKEPGEVGRALHLIAAFLGEREHGSKSSMEIYDLCLQYKIAALGPDHSSVGRTWRHMGHQHMHYYNYDGAINAYSESVRIERLQDEVDYKHVVLALNSMGMIHGMTGHPKKAVDSYSQSLAIQKAQFGDTDLQVAETLNSMGIVYGMMGEFDSAVECYSEALYVKIRKLGKDHEDVADVYFNLGLVHNKDGDHEAAINDYQEALRIRKDRLGEEHEEVARVLHHIGVVLSDMGETADAQRFYEECLRIRRIVLGDDHEDVARTLHNLGLVYYDGAEYEKALECLEEALELGRNKVGRKSEKVADTLHSMGLVYQKLANFKEAISHYEEAVSIRKLRLGEDHLDVASSLHNMGDVYYMMGDLDMAMSTYEEAYEIRCKKLGEDHVEVAATRNNMGVVYMKKGEHDEAMECFAAALKIREEKLGPDHEKCSDTLHNMGLVHKNLKEYTEAIERYEQALRVRRIQLGENDMKVADTLYNMAIVYANTGQYAKSLDRYKEALRTYRETGMSDDHPSVVNTLQWIKWAQKKLSKTSRRDA